MINLTIKHHSPYKKLKINQTINNNLFIINDQSNKYANQSINNENKNNENQPKNNENPPPNSEKLSQKPQSKDYLIEEEDNLNKTKNFNIIENNMEFYKHLQEVRLQERNFIQNQMKSVFEMMVPLPLSLPINFPMGALQIPLSNLAVPMVHLPKNKKKITTSITIDDSEPLIEIKKKKKLNNVQENQSYKIQSPTIEIRSDNEGEGLEPMIFIIDSD